MIYEDLEYSTQYMGHFYCALLDIDSCGHYMLYYYI